MRPASQVDLTRRLGEDDHENDFYSVSTVYEYVVHTFFGSVIRVFEKIPKDGLELVW